MHKKEKSANNAPIIAENNSSTILAHRPPRGANTVLHVLGWTEIKYLENNTLTYD